MSATPALDTLHNSGANIPNTDTVYPSSEYTLTEVTPENVNNLPLNVIKYYNADDKSTHYYEINFKNSVYGEGELSKYFKWQKDSNTIKLVETSNESEAVLTIKYNEGDTLNKYDIADKQTVESITEIYLGKDIKGIVTAVGSAGNVSVKAVGNTTNINSDDSTNYRYSSITSSYGGRIDSVTSSFVGNTINIDAQGNTLNGALVKVLGKGSIGVLDSEFIGNNVVVTSQGSTILGGLVKVESDGVIGNITSDFIRNTTTTASNKTDGATSLYGAVMRTDGSSTVTSSKFIENAGISVKDILYGGAIYNA
ncbi:MAG: hypothetical protein NC191_09830, partial [Muribaculaceae bacterium]|nr:hypothetical protein [Muribaculaceae bacterium]